MKKFMVLLALFSFSVVLAGCASMSHTAGGPATGVIYTNTQGPVTSTGTAEGPRMGKSSAQSILGLVAMGDASISTAAANGGIQEVQNVDQEYFSVLGIYAQTTTVVQGR